MTLTVGIDLGTTNSCIAFHDGTRSQIIDTPEGQKIMPSVVTLVEGEDRPIVGRPAITVGKEHPEYCYRNTKRLFGERWNDDEDSGFQTMRGDDGMTWLRGPARQTFRPSEIAAVMLAEMLDCAEHRLGQRPTRAVLTHPAGWKDVQKACLLDAARMAGIDAVLLHEPTAAAIAHSRTMTKIGYVAVYDWGGGTFDISIGQSGRGPVAVEASDGDPHLGGADIDNLIMEEMLARWSRQYPESDLGSDDAAMSRLRAACEAAKITLSSMSKAYVDVPLIEAFPQRSMKELLTREELEAMSEHLVARTLEKCEGALRKAGLKKGNIRDIVLVGGQTRMPRVAAAVEAFFGKKPLTDQNPEEVVAVGAAMWGAVLDRRMADFSLSDRVSHDLGFETVGDVFCKVIKQGDKFPVERTVTITSEEDDQAFLSVNVLQGDTFRASQADVVALHDHALDPGQRRGEPALDVTFSVDANGIGAARIGDTWIYRGAGDE